MSIVDNKKIQQLSKKWKTCREVIKSECPFSKNCGSFMFNVYSQDSDMDEICTRIRKEIENNE